MNNFQTNITEFILNSDRSCINITGNSSILKENFPIRIDNHFKIVCSSIITSKVNNIIKPNNKTIGGAVIIYISTIYRIKIIPKSKDGWFRSIRMRNGRIAPLCIIISKTYPAIWIDSKLGIISSIIVEIKTNRHQWSSFIIMHKSYFSS